MHAELYVPIDPALDIADNILQGAPAPLRHTLKERLETCICEGSIAGVPGEWVLLDEVMEAVARALEDWQVSVCFCEHVHLRIHTYIHTYIEHWRTGRWVCAFVTMYMHASMHKFIHTYTATYIHTYTHTYPQFKKRPHVVASYEDYLSWEFLAVTIYIHPSIHTYIHTYSQFKRRQHVVASYEDYLSWEFLAVTIYIHPSIHTYIHTYILTV
jgi:hypothetical protein